MMATPLLARRWTAVAVVVGLAVLAGCGGPADPAPIVDGLAYPDTWDLVLATEDEDTSCGELRCPTEIRYFQSEHNAARTCDEAQTAIGAAGRRPEGGCAIERCVEGIFLTASVSDEQVDVQELLDREPIMAPAGGAAVAVRARAGC